MKPRRALIRYLSLLGCVVAIAASAAIPPPAGSAPAEQTPPPQPRQRRFLGRSQDANFPGRAVLTLNDANATVRIDFGDITPPAKDLMAASSWIMTTDDKMILGKAGERVSIGNAGHSNTWLTYSFENTGEVRAFICRIGDDIYVFKVKPKVSGLSDDAQFIFDRLADIPSAEAVAFESMAENSANSLTLEQKLEIKGYKDQLSQMGVNVQWNAQEKGYIVLGK